MSSPLDVRTNAVLRQGPGAGGQVYLTFDDGPDPEWTPRVLDLLARADVRATFFVVGRRAREHAWLLRRIAEAGHEVGNHSFEHRHPWLVSAPVARGEVRNGAAAVADLLGQAPRYYRPPFGRLRGCAIDEAQRGGQRVVLWSRSAVDWGPLGHSPAIASRLRGTRPGDIVLMHDGRGRINRPDALCYVLPAFLADLRSQGLRPTSMAALGR